LQERLTSLRLHVVEPEPARRSDGKSR
jgi:hypothetical protein